MPKANNIVTTAHSQAAEMRALFGGQASSPTELLTKIDDLTAANAALTVELEQTRAQLEEQIATLKTDNEKLTAELAAANKPA